MLAGSTHKGTKAVKDNQKRNFVKEQEDFVKLLEKHVSVELRKAIDYAYHYTEPNEQSSKVEIAHGGTANA